VLSARKILTHTAHQARPFTRYDMIWPISFFFQCPTCKNYVGTHVKNGEPLGAIPNPEMRRWRNKIHARLDPLWKEGKTSRQVLYTAISQALDYEYHTGNVNTPQEATRVLGIIKRL
jgi:hypothetical protein